MKELTSQELRAMQLDVLRQFDEYCRQQDLTYFLYAGTLIGAVRHKGFIPWDDDIDVMMPRPDYERLRALCADRPISRTLDLRTPQTTPCFNAPFFKLVDNRTDGHENYLRKDIRNGVWIDIFPVDGLPADLDERGAFYREQEKRQRLLRLACRPCDFTWNPLKLAKRVLLYCLYHHVDYRKLAAEMDAAAQKYRYEDCDTVSVSVFDARIRTFEKSWFDEKIWIPFEQYEFCAPKEYDKVLTFMYGDYMTPPPADQQISHHNYVAWWVETEEPTAV